MVILDRATGCTPAEFLFALQMKYARTIADTTSTATTTEVTNITVLFLDAVIFLLHVLLLESCLKYIRTTRSEFTQGVGVVFDCSLG